MQRLFRTYRVLALIVGVLLVILTSGFILKLVSTPGSSHYDLGVDITAVVGVLHGWLYIAYLIISFVLARRLRWSVPFTLVVLAAGLIPILIFWVEHRVVQMVRADHPELVAPAVAG